MTPETKRPMNKLSLRSSHPIATTKLAVAIAANGQTMQLDK
ncbi:hypothetical protein [Neorhodopirellula lusitana]